MNTENLKELRQKIGPMVTAIADTSLSMINQIDSYDGSPEHDDIISLTKKLTEAAELLNEIGDMLTHQIAISKW